MDSADELENYNSYHKNEDEKSNTNVLKNNLLSNTNIVHKLFNREVSNYLKLAIYFCSCKSILFCFLIAYTFIKLSFKCSLSKV